MRIGTIPFLILFLSACGGGAAAVVSADLPDGQADTSEIFADSGGGPEIPLPQDTGIDFGKFDLSGDTAVQPETLDECLPGEGCFGDQCSDMQDCLSGWCVEHLGEGICSMTCQEECPEGWSCVQVSGTFPDVVFACVSDFPVLCKPCATGSDCNTLGAASNVCVNYGEDGRFCGGHCDEATPCPDGYACQDAETTEGVLIPQCVPLSGVCECTLKSIDEALLAPCFHDNEWGLCEGKRVCVEGGLTECDAAVPALETCNGLDDDCDGLADEPDQIGGDFVNLCDDDNACTEDVCAGEDGCSHSELSGVECVDGDMCTAMDHCDEGSCTGTPVICDDGNVCTDGECDGLGGCLQTPNNNVCDDDDPCTVGDQCIDGGCVGTPVSCDCTTDEDCADLEDGDLCNGTLFCDQASFPFKCAVTPASVVECPLPNGLGAVCLQASCAPETGECSLVPDHEGLACNDGDACTLGDVCTEGQCAGDVGANCNDGNPCTDDLCNQDDGCTWVHNNAPCQDGSACTLGDACLDGDCLPGPEKDCDDGNVCTTDSCDPGAGCLHTPAGGLCDDGNQCTEGDSCQGSVCAPGGALQCDDNNLCTTDSCTPETGCVFQANTAPCDDGDACTMGDLCGGGACLAGGAVDCNDGNPCTDDGCLQDTGCFHKNNQAACDDNNECTTGDVCNEGTCLGQGSLESDDQNPCTKDICLSGGGCEYEIIEGACSDGDPCTSNDYCSQGACVSGPALDCDDLNQCTFDSCLDGVCIHEPGDLDCSDDNECTDGDHCEEGQCVGTGVVDCNDDNVCTQEYCDPDTGCVFQTNTLPCDDGNACTTGDACADGECSGEAMVDCNDGNVCTDDGCDVDGGCTYEFNSAACDDGNVCTEDDQCLAGACLPGAPLDCNDGAICTADSCHPADGCIHALIQPCCGNGFLEPPEECDDGNSNNEDECTVLCQNPGCDDNIKNGGETGSDCGGPCPRCPDGEGCLDGVDCESGVCVALICLPPACDDGVFNGEETGQDCGGPCPACPDGVGCVDDSDCLSLYCEDGICQPPACDDEVFNGDETDLDCGGPCPPCPNDSNCEDGADCESGICEDGTCQPPACEDGAKNGDETDVDCGGPDCGPCGEGEGCNVLTDCIPGALCQGEVCSLYGDGQDGHLDINGNTVTINTVRSPATGTAGAKSLSVDAGAAFVAGQRVLIHQTMGTGAGQWEEQIVASKDGGTLQLTDALANDYSNAGDDRAQVVAVAQFQQLAMSSGTLTAPAWDGSTGGILAFVANVQVVQSGGSITMSSKGFRGKQHGCTYRCADGFSGESSSGPMGTGGSPAANGMGGGGGRKGQDCAAGGGGGYGAAGGKGTDGSKGSCAPSPHEGGAGGGEGGVADLRELILFGGAGGEGGGDEDGGYPGKGGDSGGIIIYRSPAVFMTGGNVVSTGGAGANGYQGCGSGCGMSGGGGGAGGGIYVTAGTAVLGDSWVTASGGGGGQCTCSNSYPAGTGGVGRIAIQATSVDGNTNPEFLSIDL